MFTAINARERGGAPTHTSAHAGISVVFYDVINTPSTPLHIGQRVQLFALLPCNNRFPFDNENSQPRYSAYDTGIKGTIVGIRSMDAAITEFVVRNESDRSSATYAHLSVEHIQGITVRIGLWTQIVRLVLLLFLTATCRIPLENKATVYKNSTKPCGNESPLRFLKHDIRTLEGVHQDEGERDNE